MSRKPTQRKQSTATVPAAADPAADSAPRVSVESEWLVPADGSFRIADASTAPEKGDGKARKDHWKAQLKESVEQLAELQNTLYAENRRALLLVFQAMDGAGKDSTIRAVLSGINPAGCQVFAFKRPSEEELDHDFLWRTASRLPERGRIGVFNRSYYEEVLAVKVNPAILATQRLPAGVKHPAFWAQRYASIRDHELHLARNGVVTVKFWLNVSKEEQRRRLLARLDEPDKHWKFESGDLAVRAQWPAYMAAYEQALNETSRPWAPWYAIPADDKPFMRAAVADIVVQTLQRLDLRYPELEEDEKAEFAALRTALEAEPATNTHSDAHPETRTSSRKSTRKTSR